MGGDSRAPIGLIRGKGEMPLYTGVAEICAVMLERRGVYATTVVSLYELRTR